MIIVSNRELGELYEKATESYHRCVNNPENTFLQDEISIPIDEIQLKRTKVKAVFTENTPEVYSWEVEIVLWDENAMIGRYTYIEDDMGNEIDNGLVFY